VLKRENSSLYSATFLSWLRYISIISFSVVASSGDLSSRYFPVNRGNLIANPLPFRIASIAHTCIGLSVISAPIISNTILGSNHTSASMSDFTLECL